MTSNNKTNRTVGKNMDRIMELLSKLRFYGMLVSSNFASADFRKIKTYNFWKSESYRFQKLRNLQISEIKSRQVVL